MNQFLCWINSAIPCITPTSNSNIPKYVLVHFLEFWFRTSLLRKQTSWYVTSSKFPALIDWFKLICNWDTIGWRKPSFRRTKLVKLKVRWNKGWMDVNVGLLAFIHPLSKMQMFVGVIKANEEHENRHCYCESKINMFGSVEVPRIYFLEWFLHIFKTWTICYRLFEGNVYLETIHLTKPPKNRGRNLTYSVYWVPLD